MFLSRVEMYKARRHRGLEISRASPIRVKKRERALSITSDSTVIDFWAQHGAIPGPCALVSRSFSGRRAERRWTRRPGDGWEQNRAHFNTSGAGFSILNPIGTILSLSWCIAYVTRWSTRAIDVCAFLRALRLSERDVHTNIRATKTTNTRIVCDCVSLLIRVHRVHTRPRDALARAWACDARKHNQGRAGQKH